MEARLSATGHEMITAFEALITRILAPLPETLTGNTPRASSSSGTHDAAPIGSPPRTAAPDGYTSACCPSPLAKGIKAYRAQQQMPPSPADEAAGGVLVFVFLAALLSGQSLALLLLHVLSFCMHDLHAGFGIHLGPEVERD